MGFQQTGEEREMFPSKSSLGKQVREACFLLGKELPLALEEVP